MIKLTPSGNAREKEEPRDRRPSPAGAAYFTHESVSLLCGQPRQVTNASWSILHPLLTETGGQGAGHLEGLGDSEDRVRRPHLDVAPDGGHGPGGGPGDSDDTAGKHHGEIRENEVSDAHPSQISDFNSSFGSINLGRDGNLARKRAAPGAQALNLVNM